MKAYFVLTFEAFSRILLSFGGRMSTFLDLLLRFFRLDLKTRTRKRTHIHIQVNSKKLPISFLMVFELTSSLKSTAG